MLKKVERKSEKLKDRTYDTMCFPSGYNNPQKSSY